MPVKIRTARIINWMEDEGCSLVFPLCVVFPQITNLVFFYFGLAINENPIREYGFIIFNVLFAVFCGLVFLSVLYKDRPDSLSLAVSGCGVAYVAVCLLLSYCKFGVTNALMRVTRLFIAFGIPAFFSGYCGAMKQKEKAFFCVLENVSIISLPAAILYCFGQLFQLLPAKWNNGASLGILNYMDIAYTFMPFLLAHVVCFREKSEWRIPFSRNTISNAQRLRVIISVIYWIAIIGTGTRGAYFCVVGACVFLMFGSRNNITDAWKRRLLPLTMIVVLFFSIFIYAPPGLARVRRMDLFITGLRGGELVTTTGKQLTDEMIESLIEGSLKVQTLKQSGYSLNNRGTLFRLAWKEFLNNLPMGMGPLGFTVKYNLYPHNAVLELLCETGVVGIVFLSLFVYALARLLFTERKTGTGWLLFAFILAYAIRDGISGSIWENSTMQWVLGYGMSAQKSVK